MAELGDPSSEEIWHRSSPVEDEFDLSSPKPGVLKSSSSEEVPPLSSSATTDLDSDSAAGGLADVTSAFAAAAAPGVAPKFYDWRETFPQLQLLYDNVAVLADESKTINSWTPWPEDHFGEASQSDWTVFPFLHTFPALDESKSSWIKSTTEHCPRTAALLRQIPTLRTALFSRLGPGTKLSSHTGWADLANYVLRCHVCVDVPDELSCGLNVDEDIEYHKQGEILVFDDSKRHKAFNNSTDKARIVLIVDLLRPSSIPLGTAKGGHTQELDDFVSRFK